MKSHINGVARHNAIEDVISLLRDVRGVGHRNDVGMDECGPLLGLWCQMLPQNVMVSPWRVILSLRLLGTLASVINRTSSKVIKRSSPKGFMQ